MNHYGPSLAGAARCLFCRLAGFVFPRRAQRAHPAHDLVPYPPSLLDGHDWLSVLQRFWQASRRRAWAKRPGRCSTPHGTLAPLGSPRVSLAKRPRGA